MASADSTNAVPCTYAFDSSKPIFSERRVFITPCTLIAAPASAAIRNPSIKKSPPHTMPLRTKKYAGATYLPYASCMR